MSTPQKVGTIRLRIGQFFSFAGGVVVLVAIGLGVRNIILLRTNVKTTGKITAVILDVRGPNFPHQETFQFATEDGKTHTVTTTVDELPRFVEGQPVTVLYKASEPEDPFNANDLWRESLKQAISGTVYIIIGIFLWRGALRARRAANQQSQGKTNPYDAY